MNLLYCLDVLQENHFPIIISMAYYLSKNGFEIIDWTGRISEL